MRSGGNSNVTVVSFSLQCWHRSNRSVDYNGDCYVFDRSKSGRLSPGYCTTDARSESYAHTNTRAYILLLLTQLYVMHREIKFHELLTMLSLPFYH